MRRNYTTLNTIALVLLVLGWLLILGGLLGIVFGATAYFGKDNVLNLYPIVTGVSASISGVLFLAFSELIDLLINIEENTRPTKEITTVPDTSGLEKIFTAQKSSSTIEDASGSWGCPKCQTQNSNTTFTCQSCGYSLQ